MSQKVAGMVWGLDLPPAEMNVLHAYADHADHNGENVRPSIDLIAWKTNLSERYVQKIVHRLRELGYLVPVRYEQGGRGHVTEYRIDFTHASWKPFERTKRQRGTKPATHEGTIPVQGEDTLTENAPIASRGADEPQDALSIKGELEDALSIKGELEDALSIKGELEDALSPVKGVLKGDPQDAPILEPKEREDPPPTSPGGGGIFSLSCGEGNNTMPGPASAPQQAAPVHALEQCAVNLDGIRGLMALLARDDLAPPPPAPPPTHGPAP